MQLQRPHLSSSKEVGKGQGYLMMKRLKIAQVSVYGGRRERNRQRSGQGHWVLRRARRSTWSYSSCPGARKQQGLDPEVGRESWALLYRKVSLLAPQMVPGLEISSDFAEGYLKQLG